MPAAWSPKDERQYKHVLKSCRLGDRRRSPKTCKRIAASTVNKQRRREGRTLDGFSDDARQAITRSPDYFVRWYTAKSLALCVAVATAAYYIGKDQGKKI